MCPFEIHNSGQGIFGQVDSHGYCCNCRTIRYIYGPMRTSGPTVNFYGLKENRELFLERAVKEAVHELGHTFRLGHCPDPGCVMHFSNSLLDTDKKSVSFCGRCQQKLKERINK